MTGVAATADTGELAESLPELFAGEAIPGVDVVATIAIVGILGYMALHGTTSPSVSHADQQADQGLQEGDQAQPCVECGQMPCFEPPEGGDRAEMARQLKDQQDLINSMSPEDMQQRLNAAQERKDATGSYRPGGDAAARSQTRSDFQKTQTVERARELRAGGMAPEAAQAQASADVGKDMRSMDATHQLDSIVGGKAGDTMGMGDSSINRSIGGQWKSRRADLQKAVNKAEEEHREKMNIKLDVCDE